MTELYPEIEKTPPINPDYKQIDDLTKKELEIIENATEHNPTMPYDVVYNFYKFLKTLTKEQQELYLTDSNKLWEELGMNDIENPYIYSYDKINDKDNELINFTNEEESDEYWKRRIEGESHDDLVEKMKLNVKKYEEPKKIICNDDYEDDVRII